MSCNQIQINSITYITLLSALCPSKAILMIIGTIRVCKSELSPCSTLKLQTLRSPSLAANNYIDWETILCQHDIIYFCIQTKPTSYFTVLCLATDDTYAFLVSGCLSNKQLVRATMFAFIHSFIHSPSCPGCQINCHSLAVNPPHLAFGEIAMSGQPLEPISSP
jgi:hypothetical protein